MTQLTPTLRPRWTFALAVQDLLVEIGGFLSAAVRRSPSEHPLP